MLDYILFVYLIISCMDFNLRHTLYLYSNLIDKRWKAFSSSDMAKEISFHKSDETKGLWKDTQQRQAFLRDKGSE